MKQQLFRAAILAGLPMLLTACVDNDYDLSNIDTTSEINVNDLVLPVNIDAITLNDIFDIDDESEIKPVVINGQEFYAVTKHGDISSQSIDIPVFTAPSPDIKESVANFKLLIPATTRAASNTLEFYYDFQDFNPQIVDIEASGLDESIKDIYEMKNEPMEFRVSFRETALPSYVSLYFEKLQLEIVKGLQLQNLPANYSYDPASGVLTITDIACEDKTVNLAITSVGVDFTKTDSKVKDGKFNYTGQVKLISGRMKATVDLTAISSYVPENFVHFTVKTNVDEMRATHFTGMIEYKLTGSGLNISPVDLTGIPDFLNQEGTDLKLANPQVYLNLNNPVADYRLYYQTGLELVAVHSATDKTPYSPDNGAVIATEPLNPGPYNFQLSPSETEPLPAYASGLCHIPFSGLSNLLSGEKLPEQIEINLVNPGLPYQKVTDFKLGQTINGISGSYDLVAPIALKSGSQIIYQDTKDGWNDEDIDKIVITSLQVDADVTSTIPLAANLKAYPIDTAGNVINGVSAECTIPANAKGDHISLILHGDIRHLDGITFRVELTPGSEEALSPEQTITLNNLKAKVSGSYTTDF